MESDNSDSSLNIDPLEFYKAMYDNHPHGILVIKNEKVFYCNKAYSNVIGYSIETILNWSIEDAYKTLKTHQKSLQNLYEQGGTIDELGEDNLVTVETGEGLTKYIEMIPVGFSFGGEDYYHTIVLDVTDRAEATRKLMDSEERFRNTFDSIPDPAYLWERNESGDIILKLANRRVVEMTRGIVNKQLGNIPNDLFVDNPEISEYISFVMDSGQRIRTETTISHPNMPNPATVLIDCVRPAEDSVLLINTDVTEERATQESARKSEQEKSIILDSMRDHLVYYESKDLTISWTNRAAAESVGVSPEYSVGKKCYEVWQGRNEPCDNCAVLREWDTGEIHVEETSTPDGKDWVVKGFPVKNMGDKVTAVVEVTRETTAEKEAERSTKEAKERAELYLDLLGHDLTNIHQGIIIGLELALQDENLPSDVMKALQASLEQVNRGVNLISNVQKFSTIIDSPTNIVPTKLLPVIDLALKMVRSSYPLRELRVNVEVPDSDVVVLADEFLVEAIYNLLHNTMKHDTKDVVLVDLKIRQADDSNSIIVQIDDPGPGVDAESKKVLLNRFVSGIKIGSGMGLTLVKRIVDRYGGKIILEDRVG